MPRSAASLAAALGDQAAQVVQGEPALGFEEWVSGSVPLTGAGPTLRAAIAAARLAAGMVSLGDMWEASLLAAEKAAVTEAESDVLLAEEAGDRALNLCVNLNTPLP